MQKNIRQIRLLNSPPQVLFFHILRENNGMADELTNQGAKSPQGDIVYNGKKKLCKYVP